MTADDQRDVISLLSIAKAMHVRILIQEIIVDIDDAPREIVLVIHWHSGRHIEVLVTRRWRAGRNAVATPTRSRSCDA